LNQKYKTESFPIFHFIYRKRFWNEKEGYFLGWERKRGLLTEFNEYLLKNKNPDFNINTLEKEKEKTVKKVIQQLLVLKVHQKYLKLLKD